MNLFRKATVWLRQYNPAGIRLLWIPGRSADIREAVDWERGHSA